MLTVPYRECSIVTGDGILELTKEIASSVVNPERYSNLRFGEYKDEQYDGMLFDI